MAKTMVKLQTKKRLDREFGPESSGAPEHIEKTCVDNARLGMS